MDNSVRNLLAPSGAASAHTHAAGLERLPASASGDRPDERADRLRIPAMHFAARFPDVTARDAEAVRAPARDLREHIEA